MPKERLEYVEASLTKGVIRELGCEDLDTLVRSTAGIQITYCLDVLWLDGNNAIIKKPPSLQGKYSILEVPFAIGFMHIAFCAGSHDLLQYIPAHHLSHDSLVRVLVRCFAAILVNHAPAASTSCEFKVDAVDQKQYDAQVPKV
jgi:hypothetical protein